MTCIAELSDGRTIQFELYTVSEEDDRAQIQLNVDDDHSVRMKSTCIFKAYHEALSYVEDYFGVTILEAFAGSMRAKKTIPPEAAA